MFFLRITIFLIIVLGFVVYFFSTRIRTEFLKTGGTIIPLFRGSSAEYKAFCNKPPTQTAAKLLKLRKKLSVILCIALFAFFITLLAVVLEQTK